MRKAIYAGSFDPPTKGHQWVIRQGAKLFDELVVAVGTNPAKKGMFPLEERLDMLRDASKGLCNVTVSHFQGKYLVDYAEQQGAQYLLKTMRDVDDYLFERKLAELSHDFNPNIQTVLMMSPQEYVNVSSSMVKSLLGFEGWEDKAKLYVTEFVYSKLKEKTNGG